MDNYLRIQKNTTIYVICRIGIKTGGTELAHQLVYQLNRLNIDAFITYITEDKSACITPGFEEYVTECKTLSDIVDEKKNLIVIPESFTFIARRYNHIEKSIWWMSVDNYLMQRSPIFAIKKYGARICLKTIIKNFTGIKRQLSIKELVKIRYHFVQSEYARLFLEKQGVKDPIPLSDYINELFYDVQYSPDIKENVIAFNPAKGACITERIMKEYTGAGNWTPIINMTNKQVQETLNKAKVYIDFGNFPGKDRIPREAALSYCCIITGMYGASGNNTDVPIDKKYKFDKPKEQVNQIIDQVNNCIDFFHENIQNFESYRHIIREEKEVFEEQIKSAFRVVK